MPSRSNLHFSISDIRALWRSELIGHSGAQSWAPECPNIRN